MLVGLARHGRLAGAGRETAAGGEYRLTAVDDPARIRETAAREQECRMSGSSSSDDARSGLKTRRRLLRDMAAAPAVLLSLGAAAWAAEQVGSVQDVKGSAFAGSTGGRRSLEPAAPVFIKDQVGTGVQSRVSLTLGQSTKLWLGERTNVTIDRFLVDAGGDITLGDGAMMFDGSAPNGSIKFKSPFGLITVRGTRFFAGPSNNVFGVFVPRGVVEVTSGGRTVVVRSGEGTNIARPGARPTRPARWGEPRIQAALISVL